jgi:hypothetical protein
MHELAVGVEADYVLVGENGEPIDLEALEAQAKPPEEWTLEEIQAAAEARWGGPLPAPDPAWVWQLVETFSQAVPEQAQETRRVANFVLSRHPETAHINFRLQPKIVSAPRRQRQREHRPRRVRAASSPRRARAPGRSADDDPSPPEPIAAQTGSAR